MKLIAKILLAAVCVSVIGQNAYAVDNSTEFGIEDDLTVLGKAGTAADPDAEILGFVRVGTTSVSPNIPAAAGSMFVVGRVEVSSGIYVTGGSTFTAGAYFTGISSFSDVANVHFGGGTVNQVLKKVAGGGMVWGDDNLGAGEISGTARRLVMFQTDGGGGADSLLQQDAGDTSITTVGSSSMTILGAFQANGVVKFNGAVTLGDAAGDAVTITGNATAAGTLDVTGASTLTGSVSMGNTLSVTGAATLSNTLAVTGTVSASDNVALSSNTVIGGAIGAIDNNARLKVVGGSATGNYAATFYSGGSLAAWIKKK